MKIFITGATGFIGTHLVRRLVQTDHEPVCYVNPTSNVRELERLGVTIILGDITDRLSMMDGMQNCGWVMHLAGNSYFWDRDRGNYWKVNVEGTRRVMECALEAGVSKAVNVSTAAIWGKPARLPISENREVGSRRFSEYAQTKYEGDLIAWDLCERKGLPLAGIYPCVVLGPGDIRPIGNYIQNIAHHMFPFTMFEDSIFTFVHVRDVVEAIIRAAEREDVTGERYIIGKQRFSIREFNSMICEISGTTLPSRSLPDYLVKAYALFITGAARVTRWPPRWGLTLDMARMMQMGMIADGSKAEQELGISYTSIRKALEDEIHPPREEEHAYKRRRYSRFKTAIPVTFQPENMGYRMGEMKDISRGGLFLETDQPLEQGLFVTAQLSEKEGADYPVMRGKVLRRADGGIAIQFIGPEVDDIPSLLFH
jgi:dihydroflavonol-4-reductase